MKLEVDFMGIPLTCDVDYQPEEADTRDTPGCSEEAQVNEALFTDNEGRTACLTALIADWGLAEQFDMAVLEAIHAKQKRQHEEAHEPEDWRLVA